MERNEIMENEFIKKLSEELERVSPSGLLETFDRQRPYNGQPWTDLGERGKTEIKGITFRDLRDCFMRACYDSSSLPPEQWPKSIHELDWDNIDPIAIEQNLSCWVERYMGIFPNIPKMDGKEDIFKDIPIIDMDFEVKEC